MKLSKRQKRAKKVVKDARKKKALAQSAKKINSGIPSVTIQPTSGGSVNPASYLAAIRKHGGDPIMGADGFMDATIQVPREMITVILNGDFQVESIISTMDFKDYIDNVSHYWGLGYSDRLEGINNDVSGIDSLFVPNHCNSLSGGELDILLGKVKEVVKAKKN